MFDTAYPFVKQRLYWFQVGAWAESDYGAGENFGEPITGASVEIRVLTNQPIVHPDADLSYWVGINLPNDAFIQVGYLVSPESNRGQPTWFWEYFPPGTAQEASVGFLGKVGSVVGPNGTWIRFSITSEGTTWSAFVDRQRVGSVDLKVKDSGTNGPYATAEVAGTRVTDNILGPVEFRNLSYRDAEMVWHEALSAVSLCCYGVGSDKLPTGTPYPYGVAGIPGQNNHWIAGSKVPYLERGRRLWPWYYVTVSSPQGLASGTGWYVKGDIVYPTAMAEITISDVERLVLKGWSEGETPVQASVFRVYSNLTLSAMYSRQFLVSISSPLGTAHGSGWYNEGENATFWVEPTSIPEDGLAGQLGVRAIFDRWDGDYSGYLSANGMSSVKVDMPKSIRAVWRRDYGPLSTIVAVMTVVLPVTVLVANWRLRKRASPLATVELPSAAPPATQGTPSQIPNAQTAFCRYCGAGIRKGTNFCRECGARLA